MTLKTQMSRVISFDGIDGSGKTTCVQNVAQYLKDMGLEVLVTCEPKGTEFGLELFDCMQMHHVSQHAAIYAMFSARAELFETVIKPFVDANPAGFVLLDRHVFSTVAYQASANSDNLHLVSNLYSSFRWMLEYKTPRPQRPYTPDTAVVFNVEPQIALDRVLKRSLHGQAVLEPLEKQDPSAVLEYYQALQSTYNKISKHRGFGNHYFNIVDVDANQSASDVSKEVSQRIVDTFEL